MNQRIGEIAERVTLRPWAEAVLKILRERMQSEEIEIVGVDAAGLPAGSTWDAIDEHIVDRVTFLVTVPRHPGVVFRVELEFDPRWRKTANTPKSN